MSEQLDLFTYYGDTGGYVNRPASVARALADIASGKLSQRQDDLLRLLDSAGAKGLTWRACGSALGLHHGQVSGALSNLHGCGMVFALKETRDKSHPYVHIKYRDEWEAGERYDEPVRTRNSRDRELQAQLLDEVREAMRLGWSAEAISTIEQVVGIMDDYERLSKQLESKGRL